MIHESKTDGSGNISLNTVTWIVAAGGLSTVLGLVVVVAWYSHTEILIQLHPTLVPMQFNTATAFLVSGLMLLAHAKNLRLAQQILALIVVMIGGLTLLEYIVGVDLGIDQLLMQHYITVESSFPGRMAPNTALGFMLGGIAMAMPTDIMHRYASPVYVTFGSLVVALAVAALVGYMVDLEVAYGWGRLTRMAIHTASGFVAIGTALLLIGCNSDRADGKTLPPWLPVPVTIAVLTVTFSLWQAVHPDRYIGAIQQAHDLVLIFGVALAAAFAFAMHKLVKENGNRHYLELEVAEHRKTQKMLRERVKELTSLYALTNVFNDNESSIEELAEMVLAIIPTAWQYPEITCAQITIDNLTRSTKNFAETQWRQTSDIVVANEHVGRLTVCYLQEMPILDDGPFLMQERDLIKQITKVFGRHLHRKKMEHQLFQAQKMDVVGQLTGGIAHDFNNLLGVIMGNIELLKDSIGETDPESKACLDDALQSTRRGASLTSHLLAFSRKQMLDPGAVDLNRLIRGMHELLQRSLGETIEIETVSAGGLWQCFVDRPQLENALLNLGLNARDAMPNGGKMTIETANVFLDDAYIETQVELSAGQYVMLAVSDTGTGMTRETMGHAFEPFYTTKAVGQGTGMGLSMIHGFAKQSRGHVNIYSEPEQGTTVKLYFPRYHGDAEAEPVLTETGDVRGGQETILVLEDDPALLKLLVNQLDSLGYSVLPTMNGNQALELIATNHDIELLLSDVILPGGLSGRDVAEQACQRRPDLKVLYMSGYTKNAIIHHGQLDSDAELLKKPFTKAGLARKLRLILD